MHIVNSMAANFGKYDLDVSAVGMRSISETDIKLPYTGVLPVQMSASSGAYVYLNVQLAQGARLVLVAHGKGKDIKRPLEASSEEIYRFAGWVFQAKPRCYRPCSVLARCVASSLYGMEKDRDRPGSAVDNPLFPVRNGS